MVARGWGRVINMASVLGVIALAGRAPYASSKAGVINLTRVLALEWAGTGVTANAICPGAFATEMNRQLLDDPVKYKEFVSRIPMGRWGELDEMAGAVVFLASPAASYVTGSALFVDGGGPRDDGAKCGVRGARRGRIGPRAQTATECCAKTSGRLVQQAGQGRLHSSQLGWPRAAARRLRRPADRRHLQHLVGADAVQRHVP